MVRQYIEEDDAFSKAKEKIDKAQKSQKENYDGKHVQEELPIGTRVWLENTAHKQRNRGKMDPVYGLHQTQSTGVLGMVCTS